MTALIDHFRNVIDRRGHIRIYYGIVLSCEEDNLIIDHYRRGDIFIRPATIKRIDVIPMFLEILNNNW